MRWRRRRTEREANHEIGPIPVHVPQLFDWADAPPADEVELWKRHSLGALSKERLERFPPETFLR